MVGREGKGWEGRGRDGGIDLVVLHYLCIYTTKELVGESSQSDVNILLFDLTRLILKGNVMMKSLNEICNTLIFKLNYIETCNEA